MQETFTPTVLLINLCLLCRLSLTQCLHTMKLSRLPREHFFHSYTLWMHIDWDSTCLCELSLTCLTRCSAPCPEMHVTCRLSEKPPCNHRNGLPSAGLNFFFFCVSTDTFLRTLFCFIHKCLSLRLITSQYTSVRSRLFLFLLVKVDAVRDLVTQYTSNLFKGRRGEPGLGWGGGGYACFGNRGLLHESIEVQWTIYCSAAPPVLKQTADLEGKRLRTIVD